MEPHSLLLFGSLVGLPPSVLIGFLWSHIPLATLSFRVDSLALGSWEAVLLPLIIIGAIAAFLLFLVVIHELVHILAFPQFGLTPDTVFGFWPSRILPYAHHSGPVSCRRLIAAALAPFIVLSVLPLFASYLGLLRSPLWGLFSILNSFACGGDILICLTIAHQVPFRATLRNKGWDTWWLLDARSQLPEADSESAAHGESPPPAR